MRPRSPPCAADLRGGAPDDVVDVGGVDAGALGERLQHRRGQLLRMDLRQRALVVLADAARRAAGIDDPGFGHGVYLGFESVPPISSRPCVRFNAGGVPSCGGRAFRDQCRAKPRQRAMKPIDRIKTFHRRADRDPPGFPRASRARLRRAPHLRHRGEAARGARHRGASRRRRHRRGRRAARGQRAGVDRAARRHGRAADPRGERACPTSRPSPA